MSICQSRSARNGFQRTLHGTPCHPHPNPAQRRNISASPCCATSFSLFDRIDDTTGSHDLVSRLLQLPCGLVRGALANLGLTAAVRASFLDDRGGMSDLPAVSFTIKIRPSSSSNNQ